MITRPNELVRESRDILSGQSLIEVPGFDPKKIQMRRMFRCYDHEELRHLILAENTGLAMLAGSDLPVGVTTVSLVIQDSVSPNVGLHINEALPIVKMSLHTGDDVSFVTAPKNYIDIFSQALVTIRQQLPCE